MEPGEARTNTPPNQNPYFDFGPEPDRSTGRNPADDSPFYSGIPK
jgi:hypothetical protein